MSVGFTSECRGNWLCSRMARWSDNDPIEWHFKCHKCRPEIIPQCCNDDMVKIDNEEYKYICIWCESCRLK